MFLWVLRFLIKNVIMLNLWFSIHLSQGCRCGRSSRAQCLNKAGFCFSGGDSVPLEQCTWSSWLTAEILLVLYYEEILVIRWSLLAFDQIYVTPVLDLIICLVLANPVANQWKILWMTLLVSGSVTVVLKVTNNMTSQMTLWLQVLMTTLRL